MPVKWVTAAPATALHLIVTAVQDCGGAVLAGPAGAGKSTVTRAAAEQLGGAVTRVVGTATEKAVPFGAFEHVIEVPRVRTAEVMTLARGQLGDGRLLVVDDAHLLDPLSCALVRQLAAAPGTRLLTAVDTAAMPPAELSPIWADGALPRFDLGAGSRFAGHLDVHVDDVLAESPGPALVALTYLAVQDPLPAPVLAALAGDAAIEVALGHGLIVGDGELFRPARPGYTGAVLTQLGAARIRRLRTEVVDRLGAQATPGVVARLRLAVLALDSDRPQSVAQLLAAAEDGLRLGDLDLGERLARAAVRQSGDFSARVQLAHALAWQGRGREADAELAQIDPAELSEHDLLSWALPRVANQFWMLSEPEQAAEFLQATRRRVTSPAVLATVDALAATLAMNAGNPAQALTVASEVLAAPAAGETAVGWAAATAALSAARMGRFGEVDAPAARAAAGQSGLLRFTSGFGRTTALLMSGDLHTAQALAQQLTDCAQMRQPGRAIGQVLLSDVLLERGELARAVTLLQAAGRVLAPTGYSWAVLASMLLARALAAQGAVMEAGKAFSRAESRHGLKSMLFAPELGLARAATAAAHGDSHGAIAAARDAAATAERGGQSAVALRALSVAVRLGDVRAAADIDRLGLDCMFATLAAAHAHALAAGAAVALARTARRWADCGFAAAAADAAAQAALVEKLPS